jgi:hypothetical protein
VLPYVDDFPNAVLSWSEAKLQAKDMTRDLEALGFLVQPHKCLGVNDLLVEFKALVFIIDLKRQVFRCPCRKVAEDHI